VPNSESGPVRRQHEPAVSPIGWGSATDCGRVREVNEDAFLAVPPLFVVADGMGGHAAGEVASRLALASFAALAEHGSISAQDALNAVAAGNQAILDSAAAHPEWAGMGTTIAGLALVRAGGEEHWMVFNVGDSRVYRLAGGQLTQLTVDHSEVEELVQQGVLRRDEALGYAGRNVITRSLGTAPAPFADSWIFPPVGGERFLVCSDGLTREIDDTEIEDCLRHVADPELAAAELVRRAVQAGGHDNVTVIVVDGSRGCATDQVEEDTLPRRHHVG